MKSERGLKKVLVCMGYFILLILCLFGMYVLISNSSDKENDRIVRAQDSNTYFRNINPKFVIDFVNNEYVRFESVSSFSNPFENKKQTIWDRIKYILGIKSEKKGIQISLLDVSYSEELIKEFNVEDIDFSEYDSDKSFELTTSGRSIGEEEETSASRDTVVLKDIYKGVDIQYQVIKGKGLKEEIVLNELPEYQKECNGEICSLPANRFLFKLDLDEGLELHKSLSANGEYPAGTYYITNSKGEYVAHFLPEFAIDSLGYKTSNVVSNILKSDSSEYVYEIILDPEWLLSKDRVFPIRIDPSIVHDSELVFKEGIYDRVELSQALTLSLESMENISGTYTSSIIDIGENSEFKGITWQGFGQATGNGEIPFSTLGIISEENFNDRVSDRKRWGVSSLQLNSGESFLLPLTSNSSDYFTLEFWSYRRSFGIDQSILESNLGSLGISENKYVFYDLNGTAYPTNIEVDFNSWQYISLVFNISSSKVTLYIDEYDSVINTEFLSERAIDELKFNGLGYIDTVRVYERMLAKNELMSNSQYSNIFLRYMSSMDGTSWDNWVGKSEYVPSQVASDTFVEFSSQEESFGNYDLLSFKFLSNENKEISLGSTKFSNGIDEEDITRLDQDTGVLEGSKQFKYFDLLFTPVSNQSACILSLGALKVYTEDTGKVVVDFGGNLFTTSDSYVLNKGNILSVLMLDNGSEIYLNGNVLEVNNSFSLVPTQYSIKSGCENIPDGTDISVSDIRLSTNQRDTKEILEYSDIKQRSYTLRPVFKAKLQNDSQIIDIGDTVFNISEMEFGATNHISNLLIGDTLVISENEFTLEGVVKSVDPDTGLVEVENWKEGGILPEGGFTTSATVLKWQIEYISTKDFIREGLVNYLSMRYPTDFQFKDVQLLSGLNFDDTSFYPESSDRYVKYMIIFITSKSGISPFISSVTIDYESNGPAMSQIMRHGKWFNEGTKQTFWWSK